MNQKSSIIMKAKRPGKCMYCGKPFNIDQEFKWHFQHHAGFCVECPTNPIFGRTDQVETNRKDITNVEVKTVEAPTYLIQEITNLFDGSFTIPFMLKDNKKRHVTLRIKTASKKSKYPGSRYIKVRNSNTFVNVAYVKANGELVYLNMSNDPTFSDLKLKVTHKAIEILVKGTQEQQIEFGMYWALLSRRCWRCGRLLTNPATLKLQSGLGPICDKIVESRGINISATKEPVITRMEF